MASTRSFADSVAFGQLCWSRQTPSGTMSPTSERGQAETCQNADHGYLRTRPVPSACTHWTALLTRQQAVSELSLHDGGVTQSFGDYDVQRDDWKPPLCVQRS